MMMWWVIGTVIYLAVGAILVGRASRVDNRPVDLWRVLAVIAFWPLIAIVAAGAAWGDD